MEEVVISRLKEEDISAAAKLIQKLHERLVETRKDIFISKEENWEEYLKTKIADENYVILVARIKEDVVGVCESVIKHCGDGIDTCQRDIWFIEYIAVDETYRRKKIGTKLLNEMKRITKESGALTLELNVWGFNKEAIEFYEKNNMKPKRIVYEYIIDKE